MAGILAAGSDAVLSHRSVASLWRLLPLDRGPVDVTIPRSARSCSLVHRHRATLQPDEVTMRHGIPVTTPSRALFDIAAGLSLSQFERAVREAEFRRLPDRPPLVELLGRYPGRRGTHNVRVTLERLSRLAPGKSRSPLEDRFLRFASRAALPMPETNVIVRLDRDTYEVDCLWREARLILELDGHEAHGTRAAFEEDRERDRRLQATGWTVIRATHRQLDEARALAADIRQLLRRASSNEAAITHAGRG